MKVFGLIMDILIIIVLVAIGNPVYCGLYLVGLFLGGILKD